MGPSAGFGGLDTPRTNIGDATYLSRPPDFDISQEASFQSPSKDVNIFQQLRNGGRPNLKTPRGGGRAPFADRRNLPAGIGGAEFTPLLKSATRNSTRRYSGKENGLATPAFLDKIDEDLTPVPKADLSVYGGSGNALSYIENTPLPQAADSSSFASTPMIMKARGDAKGPLQDGNQLSLREQENVIDRIEKENFGLKLKIHFLEEALRKAGPGFSEAALKENTDLKVDKVTMQRDLQRYKKHLTNAEKDLEGYRKEVVEMQEKAKRKYVDESQRIEMEKLRRQLQDKQADIEDLQHQLGQGQKDADQLEKLQDEIGDLEADVREKDRVITQHEDELEDLKLRADSAEDRMKDAHRRMLELEEKAQSGEKLQEAKETIEDLEADARRLEQQVDDMKDKLEEAVSEKERAEQDLEELQEEMANKSVVTKGLSRQVEEKLARLQAEVDTVRQEYAQLEQQHETRQNEIDDLKIKLKESRQARDSAERETRSLSLRLEEAEAELNTARDQKALLQTRNDALANDSASSQRDVSRLQKSITQLEEDLAQERQHSLDVERNGGQYKDEVDRLNDEISDLQAEVREKERLYDNDSDKWDADRQVLESERDQAEEKIASLQRTVDRLRETEGVVNSNEAKLQEALHSETEQHRSESTALKRQTQDLQRDLDVRQVMLEDLRRELTDVRDELRQSRLDHEAQREKAEGLEDEVEVLQTTLDEESEKGHRDLVTAHKRCDDLEKQLVALRTAANNARASTSVSQEAARHNSEHLNRLTTQLADSAATLSKVTKEKQTLQDQLANNKFELHSIQAEFVQAKAERDDLESQLRRTKLEGDDPFRVDQERIDLKTARTRLDNEVRRLRDENKSLMGQRKAMEKSLEEEIDKAAAEEERLGHEIRQLQMKVRQSSENHDLASARRTIRELERRVEDYEAQLAATTALPPIGNDGNSEISLIRRDLSDARTKEKDYLQREALHRDTVRTLKRQIAELERVAHQAEVNRLMGSPVAAPNSGHKTEISELRQQLSAAHHSIHDLKKTVREAERHSSSDARKLEIRIDEMEEQKLTLEQALDDARAAVDESADSHEAALEKYRSKLERYRRERDELREAFAAVQDHTGESQMSRESWKDLNAMLRKTQIEADALEREVREHKDALEEMTKVEQGLRTKLERVRTERASYRADVERLQRETARLQTERADTMDSTALVLTPRRNNGLQMSGANGEGADSEAIVRAAEVQRLRHQKELKGMAMHVEWLQAAWARETKLRSDASFAKRYLICELEMRVACNRADVVVLNDILRQLGIQQPPALRSDILLYQRKRPFTLQRLAIVVRFVVRAQLAARSWARHEQTRARLVTAAEDVQRAERVRRMRDEWLLEADSRPHG